MKNDVTQLPLSEIGSHKQVIWTGLIMIALSGSRALKHFFVEFPGEWLAVAYLTDATMLAFLLYAQYPRHCIRKSFQPFREKGELVAMTTLRFCSSIGLALMLMMFINVIFGRWLHFLFPDTNISHYPILDGGWLFWIDMTFGLALVAFTEEFMFRSVCKEIVEKYIANKLAIILITSLAFALVHWQYGVPNMIFAYIFGVFFMILRMETRSIVPPIITHYLFNVWAFS